MEEQQQQPAQYEASAGDDASEDANAAGVAHQQRRRGDPRNKRRAGEFDPLLLSSHLLAASPGAAAAAAAGGEDEDALSNNTSAGTLLSTDSLDRSLAGGGNALGLALPSSDQQQAPDNNSHHHHHMDDDDDDEWLTFPVVPTHVPNLVVADNASSALFSTSAPTNVASLSSSAVPTAAARGRSARRYSIAVGSTTLRDHLAPARPTLTSASSTTMPHNSSSPAAASGAARIPPRARAPTGPLPLLPTSSSSTSTSSSTVAAAHVIPLSSSASSSSFAAAALRKESKGEADYQKLRELAFKEDFRDMEQRQALYKAGRDKLGRQVVVFTLYNLGEKVDFERLLLYIIKVMDKLVEEEYALVFCQTHMTTAHRPPFTWLRKAYGMFQRKYKKNLKAAYIIHASTLVRMTLKLFKPFISSKFWKKLVYIDQYIRPDQLTLPDEVLTYNRESRATPLFGLPLAAGCARNPTTSSLPIVCERAFEILDVRAVEVEGIFRVSGSTALLNDLKQRFDRGEDVDLGFADVHTVAGLLKLYLRELPEPLMTFRLYESFIAAVRRSRDWEEIHNEIETLVQELPTENYILSARLYTLLGRVGDNADKNLMNVNNLAIVIGPNVMRAPPDAPPDRLITDAGAVNTLVKLLIQHCRSLFPADTLPA